MKPTPTWLFILWIAGAPCRAGHYGGKAFRCPEAVRLEWSTSGHSWRTAYCSCLIILLVAFGTFCMQSTYSTPLTQVSLKILKIFHWHPVSLKIFAHWSFYFYTFAVFSDRKWAVNYRLVLYIIINVLNFWAICKNQAMHPDLVTLSISSKSVLYLTSEDSPPPLLQCLVVVNRFFFEKPLWVLAESSIVVLVNFQLGYFANALENQDISLQESQWNKEMSTGVLPEVILMIIMRF